MVRPVSRGVPRAPRYSGTPLDAYFAFRLPGFHRLWRAFPSTSAGLFQLEAPSTPARRPVWALARSLAATDAIDVSFFSCGYLDVSVPRVRPHPPMRSAVSDGCCEHPPGFPIRTPPDQRSFASSPELFAGCRVLRRLSMPRHPPYTLNRLTTFIDHRLTPAKNTNQTTHTGGAAKDHASRRKGARRHPPYGKTTLLARAVGITTQAVQGRASRIRPAHTLRQTCAEAGPATYYLEPRSFTCQRASQSPVVTGFRHRFRRFLS